MGPNQKTGPDRKVPSSPSPRPAAPSSPGPPRAQSGWWAELLPGLLADHTSATATGVLLTWDPSWSGLMIDFHRTAII